MTRRKRTALPAEWPWWDEVGKALAAAQDGEGGAIVPRQAVDLRALGRGLQAIANGADAREVFGQTRTKRGPAAHRELWIGRVTEYWRQRYAGASRELAAERAAAKPSRAGPTTAAAVLKRATGSTPILEGRKRVGVVSWRAEAERILRREGVDTSAGPPRAKREKLAPIRRATNSRT
jgi:hypothetical protein